LRVRFKTRLPSRLVAVLLQRAGVWARHLFSHAEYAGAAGVSLQSIRQPRLEPARPSYRSPPPGWQKILARLAKERGRELAAVAAQLERAGK
jgi:hypothetical protein